MTAALLFFIFFPSCFFLLRHLLFSQSRFDHDRTFNTLFLKFTSDVICPTDVTAEIIRICCTAAAAVESCKTVAAFSFA